VTEDGVACGTPDGIGDGIGDLPRPQPDLTVVLCHGFGLGAGMWAFNIDDIARHPRVRRIVALDWPGMGASSRDAAAYHSSDLCPFSVARHPVRRWWHRNEFVSDTIIDSDVFSRFSASPQQAVDFCTAPMASALTQLGVTPGKYVLVGHSLGGYLSAKWAAAVAAREAAAGVAPADSEIQALVLVSPVGVLRGRGEEEEDEARASHSDLAGVSTSMPLKPVGAASASAARPPTRQQAIAAAGLGLRIFDALGRLNVTPQAVARSFVLLKRLRSRSLWRVDRNAAAAERATHIPPAAATPGSNAAVRAAHADEARGGTEAKPSVWSELAERVFGRHVSGGRGARVSPPPPPRDALRPLHAAAESYLKATTMAPGLGELTLNSLLQCDAPAVATEASAALMADTSLAPRFQAPRRHARSTDAGLEGAQRSQDATGPLGRHCFSAAALSTETGVSDAQRARAAALAELAALPTAEVLLRRHPTAASLSVAALEPALATLQMELHSARKAHEQPAQPLLGSPKGPGRAWYHGGLIPGGFVDCFSRDVSDERITVMARQSLLGDLTLALAHTPVHFVYGDSDWMYQPDVWTVVTEMRLRRAYDAAAAAVRSASRLAAKAQPVTLTVLPRSGHHLYTENSSGFAETLYHVCNSICPTAAPLPASANGPVVASTPALAAAATSGAAPASATVTPRSLHAATGSIATTTTVAGICPRRSAVRVHADFAAAVGTAPDATGAAFRGSDTRGSGARRRCEFASLLKSRADIVKFVSGRMFGGTGKPTH
jgi:pimeloyl-ACP methyl ester carboxylesterase